MASQPHKQGIQRRRWLAVGGAVGLGLALTAASLKLLPIPYVFVGLLWTANLITMAWAVTVPAARFLLVNATAVILSVTGFELALWMLRPSGPVVEQSQERFAQPDDALGYAAIPDSVAEVSKSHAGEAIFRTTYAFDVQGLRIVPSAARLAGGRDVVVFGGSFAFGAGLAASDTLAEQLTVLSDGRCKAYSFAMDGYGPHQMLRSLELNRVTPVVGAGSSPVAIYVLISDHVRRAAGLAPWDRAGPRYEQADAGAVEHHGPFDTAGALPAVIVRQLEKSLVYRRTFGQERALRDGDYELCFDIVASAAQRFRDAYAQGRFVVVYWNDPLLEEGAVDVRMVRGLRTRDLEVHEIKTILPGIVEHPERYRISEYDRHPNSRATREIARYLVNNVLSP